MAKEFLMNLSASLARWRSTLMATSCAGSYECLTGRTPKTIPFLLQAFRSRLAASCANMLQEKNRSSLRFIFKLPLIQRLTRKTTLR